MPASAVDASMLLGRDGELALIEAHLAAARLGRGAALTFSGEPGSGKTSLLAVARRRASDFTVLSCRGVEWEAELPFSGLHELTRPLLSDLAALPDPQRLAVEGAFGLAVTETHPSLHLYAGVLSLLIEATRARPVLLVVDDLHWVDGASLQVLSFVARRLAGEAIGMVVGSRPGAALAGLSSPVVELSPLNRVDVAAIAERRLGRALPEAALADLTEASGGNPLAIVESLGHCGDALWLRGTELDEPMPVGALIERGFEDRLASLSADARACLDIVAASADDDGTVLGAALAQVGLTRDAMLEAESDGVLVFDGGRVAFVHPVLRSLVHRLMVPRRLRECHSALAVVTEDVGLRAWHSASAAIDPDEEIAKALDEAAERFASRGGALAAAKALARAAALTPDADVRADRLTRAGRAAQLAGSATWAVALHDEACAMAVDPRARAWAEYRRVGLSTHLVPGQDNPAQFLAVAELAKSVAPDLAAHALANAAYEGVISGRGAFVEETVARLQTVRSTALSQAPLADIEQTLAYLGVVRGVEPILGTAEAAVLACTPRRPEVGPGALLAEAFVWIEAFGRAELLLEQLLVNTRQRGNAYALSSVLMMDGARRFRVGDWSGARVQLDESVRLAEETELHTQTVSPLGMRAVLEAARGDESLRPSLPGLDAVAQEYGLAVVTEYTGVAHGLLDLGAGRGADAARHFERVRDWKRAAGQVEPFAGTWPADLIDALLVAGETAKARDALEDLRSYAVRTNRGWARAAVARFDAQLAADDTYEPGFERSLELYVAAREPFGLARAQLAFGQRLRRERRRAEAEGHLTSALAEFERLGARPWADQARRELGVAAPRAAVKADPDALTSQEQQVAELVAGGATNKDAAGALFLSPKTIEAHLSRIYRKLGVTSRTQLAVRLASEGSVSAAPGE